MKSFLNWLEDAVATTTALVSGSPGATTSGDVAPYLRPISMVTRQFPGEHKSHRRRTRRKKHKR
jgi:hypothetical protein